MGPYFQFFGQAAKNLSQTWTSGNIASSVLDLTLGVQFLIKPVISNEGQSLFRS